MKRFLLLLLAPLCGHATVYTVNSTTDGTASNQLRGAILAADAAGGANTINVPAGNYVLTQGEIIFGSEAETITIVGAGAGTTTITMSGANSDRIFLINTSGTVSGVIVTISGITFSNGALSTDPYGGSAVLCGGPFNTTSFQNCVFSGNTLAAGFGSGGAIAMEGGGVFIVNNCAFSNNSDAGGNGGALFWFQPNNVSGSLSITNSTFTNNSCTLANAQGGAMLLSMQGAQAGITSSLSITQCTFVGNSASGTGSTGGAISIDNAFAAGNVAHLNYNRFYQNHALALPDITVGVAQGSVDATNNWWGSNAQPSGATDPHVGYATTGGNAAQLTYNPWLELTVAGSASSLCTGSTGMGTVTASFLKNSAGTAIPVANLSAVVGLPIAFTPTLGTISGAQTSIQTNGSATANFASNGTAGTASVEATTDSVSFISTLASVNFTVTAPTALATSSTSGTVVIGTDGLATDASCEEIASVVASGASPVSGSVTAGVTLDPSVQSVSGQPYVTRHYDITPASSASTATATITLYFLQSEFNAYNAVVNNPAVSLPTSSSDATGKANLTITQFHGSGTTPGNYSGWTGPGPASVLISPGSSNVVWNSAKSWWEVSFPVTGFSGFYATGPLSVPLPVQLEHFSGMLQGTGVELNWTVGVEEGMARYEVQGSVDGVSYSTVGSVAAGAFSAGATATGAGLGGAYQYFVADPWVGTDYYRLKMVNTDGSFSYSTVVVVDVAEGGRGVRVLNNPFTASCMVQVTTVAGGPVSLRLADLSGKVLWVSSVTLVAGVNTFTLPRTDGLARGLYLLSVVGGQIRETVKVVKE